MMIADDHNMNDNDESRRSYSEEWMMKAEDHIMNDESRRSYCEWWMIKTEDHIMKY